MKLFRLAITSALVVILAAGCSMPAKNTPIAEPSEAAEIEETAPTTPATIQETEPAIEIPVTEGENTPAPSPEAEQEIVHLTYPGDPFYSKDQVISDCNTGERIILGASTLIGSGCDNWNKQKLERPADMQNGTYFPAVDIIRADMGTNQDWGFARIELFEGAAGNIGDDMVYGLEIDVDLDSRGDVLILAWAVSSTGWSTNHVQVWQDQNKDVGGSKPHSPDGQASDGYETLLFDSGRGQDPDLAWARIEPLDASNIEIAFKPGLLPANRLFAWWAWSSMGRIDPSQMELVDTQVESEIWQADNTCGWIFNGKPTRMLVNICDFSLPTSTPSPTPTVEAQIGCVIKTDAQCNAEANPQHGGFPWWFDLASCSCKPTN